MARTASRHLAELWNLYAPLALSVGERTVQLTAAYDPAAAEAFCALSPHSSLAEAMEPWLQDCQRAALASGTLAGPEEVRGWAAMLRHQMACARGLPAEALWHGPRGRDRSWVLCLSAFVEPDGTLASDSLARAVACAVTALDLAGAFPPTRVASVIAADLAGALMALGVPYGWPEGRATAAALLAIMLGAAAEGSAALAVRLGPCPAWSERRSTVLRALEAARRRCNRGRSRTLTMPPARRWSEASPPRDGPGCGFSALSHSVRRAWSSVCSARSAPAPQPSPPSFASTRTRPGGRAGL